MVLVFLVFFLLAVLSCFAETEESDCAIRRSVSTDTRPTLWNYNLVYPVRVCVSITWKVKECSKSSDSFVSLNITHSKDTEVLTTKFSPDKVNGRFCEIFDPCRIAKALEGKDLTVANITATAQIFVDNVDPNQKPAALNVRITTTPKVVAKEGDILPLFDHELLAVLCYFPECSIQSEGFGGDGKFYFNQTELNQAPKCVEKGAAMFSVTHFLCEPKCSRKYTALKADVEPSPRPQPTTPAVMPTDAGKEEKPLVDLTATTSMPSNAFSHLGIKTILTVVVLALLA